MNLDEIRKEIDITDAGIKRLFQQRMEVSKKVALIKSKTGDKVLKADREAQMIARLTEGVDPSIKKEYKALIKRIVELSRKYQYGVILELNQCFPVSFSTQLPIVSKVCCLTTPHDNEWLNELFLNSQIMNKETKEEIFDMVVHGDADMGILPLFDVGTINEIYTLLAEKEVFINFVYKEQKYKRLYVVFSKKLVVLPQHNTVMLSFSCENGVGRLASVLSMIADYEFIITNMQIVPHLANARDVKFFVEIVGNLLDKEMQTLVYQLTEELPFLKTIGSYTIGQL